MDRVPLSEADGHMAELIDRVENGEEIVILRDGKPAVKLVPVAEDDVSERAPPCKPPIRFGFAKGQIRVADDFDAPLPEDLLKSFYGLAPDEVWPDSWKDVPGGGCCSTAMCCCGWPPTTRSSAPPSGP